MTSYFSREWCEHIQVAGDAQRSLEIDYARALDICVASIRSGGKLIFFGNGGSAADAQHLATELTIRYKKDRLPIAAIALTTDSSALTAAGNDLGFDQVFSRQLEALGRAGDVAIGITTSGRSPNVIRAFQVARSGGLRTIALTGGNGGGIVPLSDVALVVPSSVTARIQEMHITIGQILCGQIEIELGLVGP